MIRIWDLNHWDQNFLALFVIPNPSQLHVGNILNQKTQYIAMGSIQSLDYWIGLDVIWRPGFQEVPFYFFSYFFFACVCVCVCVCVCAYAV